MNDLALVLAASGGWVVGMLQGALIAVIVLKQNRRKG